MPPQVAAVMKAKPNTYSNSWADFKNITHLEVASLSTLRTRPAHVRGAPVAVFEVKEASSRSLGAKNIHTRLSRGKLYHSPWGPNAPEGRMLDRKPCRYCRSDTHSMGTCPKLWIVYYYDEGLPHPEFVKTFVAQNPAYLVDRKKGGNRAPSIAGVSMATSYNAADFHDLYNYIEIGALSMDEPSSAPEEEQCLAALDRQIDVPKSSILAQDGPSRYLVKVEVDGVEC